MKKILLGNQHNYFSSLLFIETIMQLFCEIEIIAIELFNSLYSIMIEKKQKF